MPSSISSERRSGDEPAPVVGKALNQSPAGTSEPKRCAPKWPRINVDLGCQGYCKPIFDRHQFETFWELIIKKHIATSPLPLAEGLACVSYPITFIPYSTNPGCHFGVITLPSGKNGKIVTQYAVKNGK